jgi:hypothetical protein
MPSGEVQSMRREYDIFERFRDGSTLWRATILGRYEANRKMDELAEHSNNQFFTIDVQAAESLPPRLANSNPGLLAKSAAAG